MYIVQIYVGFSICCNVIILRCNCFICMREIIIANSKEYCILFKIYRVLIWNASVPVFPHLMWCHLWYLSDVTARESQWIHRKQKIHGGAGILNECFYMLIWVCDADTNVRSLYENRLNWFVYKQTFQDDFKPMSLH